MLIYVCKMFRHRRLLERAVDVIRSCYTEEQLKMAHRYCRLACHRTFPRGRGNRRSLQGVFDDMIHERRSIIVGLQYVEQYRER